MTKWLNKDPVILKSVLGTGNTETVDTEKYNT